MILLQDVFTYDYRMGHDDMADPLGLPQSHRPAAAHHPATG